MTVEAEIAAAFNMSQAEAQSLMAIRNTLVHLLQPENRIGLTAYFRWESQEALEEVFGSPMTEVERATCVGEARGIRNVPGHLVRCLGNLEAKLQKYKEVHHG